MPGDPEAGAGDAEAKLPAAGDHKSLAGGLRVTAGGRWAPRCPAGPEPEAHLSGSAD